MYIGAGVLLITALVLSYFLFNGALYDLWDVYFYTNIFKYPANSTGLYNMFVGLAWLVFDVVLGNIGFSLLLTVGVVWAVVKHRFRLMAQVVLMLLFGAIVIYSKLNPLPYYALIFCGFSIFGFIPVYSLVSKIVAKWNGKVYVSAVLVACVLIVPATYLLSENTYMLQYHKQDLPQYQFAEIINQKENATLLNYGFLDGGFYTTTGIVPNMRYFCTMNANRDEAVEAQQELVDNGAVDFVVTRNKKLDSTMYEERMVSRLFFEDAEYEYTLYERKAD